MWISVVTTQEEGIEQLFFCLFWLDVTGDGGNEHRD